MRKVPEPVRSPSRASARARLVVGVLALGVLVSCSSTPRAPSAADSLTVEGSVTVRGNEPFTDLFLETDGRNVYVLSFEEGERGELQRATPGRFRVTGRLYKGDWNGRPYAFVAVASWRKL